MRAMFAFKTAVMQRLRFAVAMLAVAGSMWALVDLHQHQDGLHQVAACTVCSLEAVAGSGTLTVVMQTAPFSAIASDRQPLLAERRCAAAARRIAPIRAPPFA